MHVLFIVSFFAFGYLYNLYIIYDSWLCTVLCYRAGNQKPLYSYIWQEVALRISYI